MRFDILVVTLKSRPPSASNVEDHFKSWTISLTARPPAPM